MPNDINGVNSRRNHGAGDRSTQSVQRGSDSASNSQSSNTSSSASNQDSVSLTNMAERLQRLESNLAQHSEVDQTRVENIKDSMSRGEYKVNPERVADKMMDFEKDF